MSIEKIIPNPKMMTALDKSIEKWEKIVNGSPYGGLCPLCDYNKTQTKEKMCTVCPIAIDTSRKHCEGTAYYTWSVALAYGNKKTTTFYAQQMLDYLISLRDRINSKENQK